METTIYQVAFWVEGLGFMFSGQGDLVCRSITPLTHRVVLIIHVINLLAKSP